jgi:deoxyribose-phosphate aldolase
MEDVFEDQLNEIIYPRQELEKLIAIIDLTSLNPSDNEESIINLCKKAETPLGKVAAVCVFPQFIPLVKANLGRGIRITSVTNFPTGKMSLETALADIHQAISAGANEMDVVMPYSLYKEGKEKEALDYIRECKKACGHNTLKVILETSEFDQLGDVYTLSKKVITTGADFLKTSTGKSSEGANIVKSGLILLAIKQCNSKIGFKASGGIKAIWDANAQLGLAAKIMGEDWITSSHFRIGASGLVDEIMRVIKGGTAYI